MIWQSVFLTVFFTTGLLIIYLQTFVKSTVSESIRHAFDIERDKMRSEFEREMKSVERKDRFRLAALEERLKVYQMGFALWRRMSKTLYDSNEEKKSIREDWNKFWDEHSLYLSNEARKAFLKAYVSYSDYTIYLQEHRSAAREGDREYLPEAKNNLLNAFNAVSTLGDVLQEAVDLEAMGGESIEVEGKRLTPYGFEEIKGTEGK